MNDFNILIETYNNTCTCLSKIINNHKEFKNKNHLFIFSFLLGYFTKNKININDFNDIFSRYQKEIFNGNHFLSDFKTISNIFCNYYAKKNLNNSNNIMNKSKISFNNINIKIKNSKNNHFINNNGNNMVGSDNSNNSIQQSNFNNNQINNINEDYKLAKQIEEQEKILLQVKENKDESEQKKKCEICLEDFSLLDARNY